MVAFAAPDPYASSSSQEDGRSERILSAEELFFVKKAKQEHQQTTEAAKRALQVAEATQDVARGTLVEVHRQGQQLDKVQAGVDQIEEDVSEASSLVRFMRRWCCFQLLCCCDCFDPDLKRDRGRKGRVQQRRENLRSAHSNIELHAQAKQQAVDRKVKGPDPAFGGNEAAARDELFSSAERIRAERRRPKANDIGLELPEEHWREIQAESDQQEQYLDRIGEAVGALHIMSQEMHDELRLQDPKVEQLNQRAAVSHDKLGGLAREARRI